MFNKCNKILGIKTTSTYDFKFFNFRCSLIFQCFFRRSKSQHQKSLLNLFQFHSTKHPLLCYFMASGHQLLCCSAVLFELGHLRVGDPPRSAQRLQWRPMTGPLLARR